MSAAILTQHYLTPHHMGALLDADAMGQEGLEGAGPFLKVYLKWDSNNSNGANCEGSNSEGSNSCERGTEKIAEAWFETYGCPVAIACGSWLMQWVEGKTKKEAQVIEPRDLELVLGGLPLGKEHCASLAVKALHASLRP